MNQINCGKIKRQDACTNVSIKFNLENLNLTDFLLFRDHQSVVSNCTFDRSECLYATCSWDKMILLYDITTGAFR
jgi:WD40 repeat protein